MIVEFTGCTGAGKTTLSAAVIEKLSGSGIKTVAVHPRQFYLWGMRVKEGFMQNVAMDLKVLPFFIRSIKIHLNFVVFAIRVLCRHSDSMIMSINLFRSIIRKLGTHDLLRKTCTEGVAIMDEGPVHSAHNLFVQLKSEYAQEDIIEFGRLVPLPDMIVCVSAPDVVLVQRIMNRSDPPRRGLSCKEKEWFVKQGERLFREVCTIGRIRKRLILVNCSENNSEVAGDLAEGIARYILELEQGNDI